MMWITIDLIVENEIILELKAVEKVIPIHEAQLLSYLKLSNKQIGLLINFNVPVLKDGIRRVAVGDLFKSEKTLHSALGSLALLLCASVPLWFKN